MSDPHDSNPYSTPAVEEAGAMYQIPTSLYLLWSWLAVATVFSFVGTPADPISMLLALALGILCFCAGCILGAQVNLGVRLLGIVICLAGAGCTLALLWNQIVWLNAINICYCLASLTLGTVAYRTMPRGRLRIVGCFVAGYVLGTILGPLGTIAGSATGALLARRSLKQTVS